MQQNNPASEHVSDKSTETIPASSEQPDTASAEANDLTIDSSASGHADEKVTQFAIAPRTPPQGTVSFDGSEHEEDGSKASASEGHYPIEPHEHRIYEQLPDHEHFDYEREHAGMDLQEDNPHQWHREGAPTPTEPAVAPRPLVLRKHDSVEQEEEDSPAEGRMTFMEHLLELRGRLVKSVLAIVVMMILSFVFWGQIWVFLRAPLDNLNESWKHSEELRELLIQNDFNPNSNIVELRNDKPMGTLMIFMKIAMFAGLVFSSPIVLFELWRFIAPGLTDKEKNAIRPVLYFGFLFFLGGAAFCYYLIFPMMLNFLVWFDVTLKVLPWYNIHDFVELMLSFMLICGAVFELPLICAILARLGILRLSVMTRFWRIILVGCFIAGSLLSPGGDPMSMLMMSGALVVLYGLSLLAVKIFYPRELTATDKLAT